MNTQENIDYKTLLTNLIHKQMLILGPTMPLMLIRDLQGVTTSDNGTVIGITGDAKLVIAQFIKIFQNISETLVNISIKPIILTVLGEKFYTDVVASRENMQIHAQLENNTNK